MNVLLSFQSVIRGVGSVLLAIGILLVMVMIHEFGHYLAGKILRFKINEFSVGFGPALFKKKSKRTGEEFSLRLIPLGGYCAFEGEDEREEEETLAKPFAELEENSEQAKGEEGAQEEKGVRFNDQAPWKRIIVLIAGATMNYLLAVSLIILMFASVGRPIFTVWEAPVEGEVSTLASHEEEVGLIAGDKIVKVNGDRVYLVTDYMDALRGKKQGDSVKIVVLREVDGKSKEVTVEVVLTCDANFASMSDTNKLLVALGLDGLYTTTEKQGWYSVPYAFEYSVKIGGVVLRSLGELLTGRLGLDSIGGPITTIKITSQQASSGAFGFLNIAAFIGVNLAVFNLLPIPALDGSKVIFCLIEWIRKKPLNRKVETMIHFIGIIFLFAFAILVDLLQFF